MGERLRRGWMVLGLVMLALPVPGTARSLAQELAPKEAWIALPAAGAKEARAFVSIQNPGFYSVYLLSGVTDVAEKVEFRNGAASDALMKDIEVRADQPLVMSSKGPYLRLVNLTRPLNEGDQVRIALEAELNEKVYVVAVVRKEAP